MPKYFISCLHFSVAAIVGHFHSRPMPHVLLFMRLFVAELTTAGPSILVRSQGAPSLFAGVLLPYLRFGYRRNLCTASQREPPFARSSMTQRHSFAAVRPSTWNNLPTYLRVLLARDSAYSFTRI